jgi:hypothetical protein
MATPGKLTVDAATGRLHGPASIAYNSPWPCANGSWGSGAMMGTVMHTMVGNLPGTVAWFNDPQAQASAFFGVDQAGSIHQFGPVGQGWVAWAQAGGNKAWYSVEFADDGNPANPLTAAQVAAGAQLLECLSAFAGFPLQASDSPSVKGYGWHGMGGSDWGGHPACPGGVRNAQRAQIVALAQQIRSPARPAPVAWMSMGTQTLAALCAARKTSPAAVLEHTAQTHGFAPPTAEWLDAVLSGTISPAASIPAGVTLLLPF